MKVNEMQIYSALNEYINRYILPLGASMKPTEQFFYGVKISFAKTQIQNVIKTYLSNPKAKEFGIIDEEGKIDVQPLYQAALESMHNVHEIDVGGIIFKEEDINNLYGIMQKYGG